MARRSARRRTARRLSSFKSGAGVPAGTSQDFVAAEAHPITWFRKSVSAVGGVAQSPEERPVGDAVSACHLAVRYVGVKWVMVRSLRVGAASPLVVTVLAYQGQIDSAPLDASAHESGAAGVKEQKASSRDGLQ